nr:unconventional prefoldin RPB5 interactor-like [Procambarus clarkii]
MKKTLSPIPDEGNGASGGSGSVEGSVSIMKLKENLSNLVELQKEHKERLGRVEEEIAKLQTFKKDYEHLLKRLLSLPDKTAHEVMVPFGPLAFMPGHLVHTNEILVLLGDNWFAERSAKQAAGIVRRRLKDCEEKIKCAENTKTIHTNWLKTAEEVLAVECGDQVDIVEEITEEEYQKSREEEKREVSASEDVEEPVAGTSAASEDSNLSDLDDKFVKNLSETDRQIYEDITKRLNQIELEDEATGEDDDDDDDDEGKEFELRTMSDEGETSDAMLPAKRAKFKRRVSWADDVRTLYTVIPDDDSEDICRIKYTSQPLTLPLEDPLTESVGKTEAPTETIQSPSDIYKVFSHGASAPEPPPRGILKKSSSLPIQGKERLSASGVGRYA